MERSRTARRLAAAALAFHAGVALTVWGAAGAEAGSGSSCDAVTGHLVDHGTTVTGVFDVPSTCEEVSVLSWFAAGPDGEQPQVFLDRIGHDNVAPGHYEWTIAAPPPECFRQLDLRVPGRNVDSIVGGEHQCQSTPPPSSPTTTSTSTTTPSVSPTTPPTTESPTTTSTSSPTTTTTSTSIAPAVSTTSTSGATSSTTSTVVVLGEVLTPPAAQGELARTGRSLAEVVGVALIGIGLGLGVLIAQERQRQTRAD